MKRVAPLLLLAFAGCEGVVSGGSTRQAPQVDPETGRLICDDRRHPASTEGHRLTPAEYRHAIAGIFGGAVPPSPFFPAGFGTPRTGFSTEPQVNEVGEQGATQLLMAAEDVAVGVHTGLDGLLPCAASANPGQACLDTFVATYARRAFRRTLTADEAAALQAVFDQAVADGATFDEAVAVVTSAVLQSPQFLYVVEDAAGDGRALTGVELASRLSFLLWDSGPDDELLDLAESGQLSDPAVLKAQARRLFDSPSADPALTRYVREWTQAATLLSSDKDQQQFPFFDAAYAAALDQSFDRFAVSQLRGGGTLASLLTTTDAFVNDALAPSFGVAAPGPGQWVKATADAQRHAGLVTHPLLLADNAHPSASSFVFRGRTLQQRVLCTPLGTPPANAQAQFSAIPLPPDPTGREVSAAVISNNACAGCHRVIDPAGLALEHFDAAGRYRETYASGRAIDTKGTLLGLGSGPLNFDTPVELAAGLASRPETAACTARQVFRYTFSRLETEADGCAVQAIGDALEATGGDLQAALLAVVTTDSFTWRVDP